MTPIESLEAEFHPTVALFLDALRAVRARFTGADPPIRSLHTSVPAKPRHDPAEMSVWFLVEDEKLTRATERGILAEVQETLAQELAERGNPERKLGDLFVHLAPRSKHDWRACLKGTQASRRETVDTEGSDRA